jgi:hypothetical protein
VAAAAVVVKGCTVGLQACWTVHRKEGWAPGAALAAVAVAEPLAMPRTSLRFPIQKLVSSSARVGVSSRTYSSALGRGSNFLRSLLTHGNPSLYTVSLTFFVPLIVAQRDEHPPGDPDRVVRISGRPEQVEQATVMIREIMEKDGGPGSSGGAFS